MDRDGPWEGAKVDKLLRKAILRIEWRLGRTPTSELRGNRPCDCPMGKDSRESLRWKWDVHDGKEYHPGECGSTSSSDIKGSGWW